MENPARGTGYFGARGRGLFRRSKVYWNLGNYFGALFEPSLSKKNLFAQYQAAGLPWKGWVTYHPAYLRRSNQESVLELMAESIRQSLALITFFKVVRGQGP